MVSFVVVPVIAFSSSWSLSCCRNSSRGMPRRRRATASNSRISPASGTRSSSAPRSSASFSRSMGSRSAMFATCLLPSYPGPQALQAAKLQLLDRPFATPHRFRNFARAFLLHETQLQNLALVFGQFPHQRKNLCPILRLFLVRCFGFRRSLHGALPAQPLPPVRDLIRRNAE